MVEPPWPHRIVRREEVVMPELVRPATLREGRAGYFAKNGWDEKGYDVKWVRIQAGPIPLFIYNTEGRKKAVKLHDLHHVLTGYETTWTGEAEIGGWELAGGCGWHLAAWYLNAWAFAIGLVIAPRRTIRAFRRGLHERNLYRETLTEALLDSSIDEVRARLGIGKSSPGSPT
jgi:hypothetical protein